MKRLIPVAIVLTIAACGKTQETAQAPQVPSASQQAAQQAAQSAKEAALEATQATKLAAEDAAKATKLAAQEAAQTTKLGAQEAAQATKQAAQEAAETTKQMVQNAASTVASRLAPQPSTAKSDKVTTEPSSGSSGGLESSGASGNASEYTVVEGDTLSRIARAHGLNSQDIVNWNNIKDPNLIREGQTLRLTAP